MVQWIITVSDAYKDRLGDKVAATEYCGLSNIKAVLHIDVMILHN
jgi:hypothetical protein